MIRHIHALLNNTVNAGSMLDGVVGGVIKVHAHARLVFPFFLRLGKTRLVSIQSLEMNGGHNEKQGSGRRELN